MENNNKSRRTVIIDFDKNISDLLSELLIPSVEENSVVRIINGAKLTIDGDAGLTNKLHLIIEDGSVVIESGMTLTVGDGVEITISATGWIEGGGTLNGKFAHISAPMRQVFYGKLDVTGFWTNERVYPQWFGAVAYDSETQLNPVYCSDAIVRAAKMAGTGEVFIPRGYYYLDKSIDLDCGVTISGETGLTKGDSYGTILIALLNYYTIYWGIKGNDKNGPILSNELLYSNYLFHINVDWQCCKGPKYTWRKPNWKVSYPPMSTTIRNLRIKNKTFPDKNETGYIDPFVNLLSCVLAGDSTAFDNVIFDDFGQAVRYIDQYLDNKRVTNCTFYCNHTGYTGSLKHYAFDLGFLGDGVLFEHNAIHDGMQNKGLRISHSGGASINANIINADVLIHNSRGVDFSANHIEEQHTIRINGSQTSLCNNYMWIGNSPAVMIYSDDYQNKSIVTMNGNVFKFNDTIFYQDRTMPSDDMFKCGAEVAIDEYSVLSIGNCYRYWGGKDFGGTQTTGIGIAKLESDGSLKTFDEFNNYSYALSRHSSIGSGFEIEGSFSVHSIANCRINPIAMLNSGVLWRGDSGEYTYSAQVFIDERRGIGLNAADVPFWVINYTESTSLITKDGDGILINLGKSSGRYMLRLFRMRCDDMTSKYVDIPICDTTYLYDNGLSVNGFEWMDYTDENFVAVNHMVESVEYHSGNANVIVGGNLSPDDSNWTKGDIVYLPKISGMKIVD